MAVEFYDSGRPLCVRYPMNQQTWDKVVVDTQVALTTDQENLEFFIVEYESRTDFESECARFEGMVEYKELPTQG